MVPLDVVNAENHSGLNMSLIWTIVLATQLICVWVVFPVIIVYYEGNEEDNIVSLNSYHSQF